MKENEYEGGWCSMGEATGNEFNDLTGADLEKRLSGELQYMAIRNSDATQYNRQIAPVWHWYTKIIYC